MAVQKVPELKAKPMPPIDITINDFTGGVNSLVDESSLNHNAAADVTNLMQKQNGLWSPRWGTQNYGPSYTTLDGVGVATKTNADGTFTQYLLRMNNGVLERVADGGSAVTITGKTYTVGYHAVMLQIASRVYIVNGKDVLSYYDVVADNIVTYAALATPSAPTLTRSTDLAAGSFTLFYQISAVNAAGETIASPQNSAYTVNVPRNQWQHTTSINQNVQLTWTAVPGAVRYNVYYADNAIDKGTYLDSVGSNAYTDDSRAAGNNLVTAPVADTTVGPLLSRLEISDNRIWGIATDGAVWWSGTGQYQGSFSPFYGGGYIYLEKGGNEHPTGIKFYRNGKGDPQTTVFTVSPDGTGSEWQISLSNTTIGTVSYITPAAVKVVGSTGSGSPDGIISARNNVYYLSHLGFFSLGAKPVLLNVLSTDEISLPIRPNVRALNNAQRANVSGIFYDGKLFWAVPNGTTLNNEIWVLDLEHNSWARPWAIGIRQFIIYTSSDGIVHMLGVPSTGTNMIEFGENFLGDNGVAIACTYRGGLIFADKNHHQAFKAKYTYVELSRPQGTITFSALGTRKNKNFNTLGSKTIANAANIGTTDYSTELFSELRYSDPATAPTTFSQASVLKRLKLNKLVYNLEFQVTSNSNGSAWALNQFMITGHEVKTSDPANVKN